MLNVLLIPALPLLAAVAILFAASPWLRERASRIAIGAISVSFLLSLVVLLQASGHEGHGPLYEGEMRWLTLGTTDISLGIMVDNLSALMLVIVTLVALLVQVYSLGYMHGDPRFSRYYGFLSLFTFSMLGLVLSDNILQLFIFWELVGLCSYLLIGFWNEKPAPQLAQKKAFLVTKAGDLGFFLGVMAIFALFGSFRFEEILAGPKLALIAPAALTFIALALFFGAMGKSAQFPLHIWLPNAMEGPTPVSALIHAATMVAAGIFLVARMYPLFEAAPYALAVVAIVGTVTLFMAATIALTVFDIKGVLAYSTISQLGYMMLGLGAGSLTAGMFHLMTHAFFKALLFLGAGSVIHAVHTQDLREMGGLRKDMPLTFWTFLIATLALAGIFPLAGFWSKDEILLAAWHHSRPLFFLALAGAFMTALYMFRLVFLCFFGAGKKHGHESPDSMTRPLLVLAVLSAVAGLVATPLFGNWFQVFIHGAHEEPSVWLMLLSTLAAGAGIGVAYLAYFRRAINVAVFTQAIRPLYVLVKNKYYVDEVVDLVFVRGSLLLGRVLAWLDHSLVDGAVNAVASVARLVSKAAALIDTYLIDGAVNFAGWLTRALSRVSGLFDLYVVDGAVNLGAWLTGGFSSLLRATQSGQVQSYVMVVFAGLAAIAVLVLFGGMI